MMELEKDLIAEFKSHENENEITEKNCFAIETGNSGEVLKHDYNHSYYSLLKWLI